MTLAEWTLKTAPTIEPVTLAEAKLHLRVDHSVEDALIAGMITTARQLVEEITGRSLISQTWELTLDGWPDGAQIRMPRPPLLTVSSIVYTDTDGQANTLAATNYTVATRPEPGIIALTPTGYWPSATLYTGWPILITYTCGYGSTVRSVPEPIRSAILLTVGYLYQYRDATEVAAGLPLSVRWLLTPWRIAGEYP